MGIKYLGEDREFNNKLKAVCNSLHVDFLEGESLNPEDLVFIDFKTFKGQLPKEGQKVIKVGEELEPSTCIVSLSINRSIEEENLLDLVDKWGIKYQQVSYLYEQIPEAILLVNNSREVVFSNSAACDLFAYSKREFFGLNVINLLPIELQANHEILFNSYYKSLENSSEGIKVEDFVVQTKKGEKLDVVINVNPFHFCGEGNYIVSVRDISEEVKKKKELYDSKEKIRKQKEEIESTMNLQEMQRKQLEEYQKDSLAALNYAQYVLESTNETEVSLKQLFPKSFMMFIPQHLVGGDFVWKMDSKLGKMLAVVDCMGHGVPGSLLAMSVYNCLTTVLRSGRFYSLTEFLVKVSKMYCEEIFDVENPDSFDIGMISYDEKANLLFCRGIKRPVLLFTNGELEIIKGHKLGVKLFYLEHENNTTNWDIVKPVSKGDRVFLLSDGYVDQFGGKEGKKYKFSQLKELLLKTMDLSIEEQGEKVKESFFIWKDGHATSQNQVDDVTIVGIEL